MTDLQGSRRANPKGRVTMIATGSRGDVQPQVALASALEKAGWNVKFATHRCFESLVASARLEFCPIAGDARRFLSGATAATDFRDRHRRPDIVRRYLKPFIRKLLMESLAACEGADAILYWPPTRVGPPLAEKLRIPCFAVSTYPLPHCRTKYFPNPFAEPLSPGFMAGSRVPLLRQWVNLQTWRMEEQVWRDIFESEVTTWRHDVLGLTGESAFDESELHRCVPHLLGYSPSVLPVPADWPSTLHVTGYWFHDLAGDWRPPEALVNFLESGPPPIAIGFGSMVTGDDRATGIVLQAVRQAGVRAVVMRGWGGLVRESPDTDKDVCVITEAPHDWLFPRVAAVVHHCGSGTTAAGVRAGLPTLGVPFGFDQFLWARRLHALGVSPRPAPRAHLTVEGLATRLRELVSDRRMGDRARALGERIGRENGLGAAVEAFEYHMKNARPGAAPSRSAVRDLQSSPA